MIRSSGKEEYSHGVPSFIRLASKNCVPTLCKAKLDEKRFLGGISMRPRAQATLSLYISGALMHFSKMLELVMPKAARPA